MLLWNKLNLISVDQVEIGELVKIFLRYLKEGWTPLSLKWKGDNEFFFFLVIWASSICSKKSARGSERKEKVYALIWKQPSGNVVYDQEEQQKQVELPLFIRLPKVENVLVHEH